MHHAASTTGQYSGRILLAEGNRLYAQLVSRALEDAGYYVHMVGTRAEVEAQDASDFDALLIADQLEDGSGSDLIRALDGAAPVVMLVDPGQAGDETVEQVVKQPEMAAELRVALGRALERRRLQSRIDELERRLEETTRVDAVSGLYTGRYFLELLARELARIGRFGGTMALVRLAGPSGETVERTLGAHVRDRIVREIGQLLRTDLRLTDLAGSWPDGHFLVALTGTDRPGAETVVTRLTGKVVALERALALSEGIMPRPTVLGAGGHDALSALSLD